MIIIIAVFIQKRRVYKVSGYSGKRDKKPVGLLGIEREPDEFVFVVNYCGGVCFKGIKAGIWNYQPCGC